MDPIPKLSYRLCCWLDALSRDLIRLHCPIQRRLIFPLDRHESNWVVILEDDYVALIVLLGQGAPSCETLNGLHRDRIGETWVVKFIRHVQGDVSRNELLRCFGKDGAW